MGTTRGGRWESLSSALKSKREKYRIGRVSVRKLPVLFTGLFAARHLGLLIIYPGPAEYAQDGNSGGRPSENEPI